MIIHRIRARAENPLADVFDGKEIKGIGRLVFQTEVAGPDQGGVGVILFLPNDHFFAGEFHFVSAFDRIVDGWDSSEVSIGVISTKDVETKANDVSLGQIEIGLFLLHLDVSGPFAHAALNVVAMESDRVATAIHGFEVEVAVVLVLGGRRDIGRI